MPVLSPRNVYAPGREPPKSEIIQLLEEMIFGASVPAVIKLTRAALFAITPPSENYGGQVLNDPNPAYNGYYARSGAAWIKGRNFADTLSRMTVTGGTANAVAALASEAIPGATVVAYVIKPALTNTGPVTINGKALRNVNGAALALGEFPAGRMIMFTDEGATYQMVSDPAVDALLAQAIDLAGETAGFRNEAEGFRDEAAGFAAGLNIAPIAPGDAGGMLVVKGDATGSEWLTVTEVMTKLGINPQEMDYL